MSKEEAAVAEGHEAESEELSYDDIFDALADGKEPAAATEDKEEASTSDSKETPAKKDLEDDADSASEQGKKAGDSEGEEDDPLRWIEELPEEFREQAKALQQEYEHKLKSQTGRVRSLQSALDEERARRAAARSASQPQRQGSSSPSGEENEELSAKIKQLKEEYPDLVDLVETLSDAKLANIQKAIDEKVSPLNEEVATRRIRESREKFERAANDILKTEQSGIHYTDVFASDEYRDFLQNQPARIQRMAATSTDPDEAAWILQQFVKEQETTFKQQQEAEAKKKKPAQDRRKKLESNVSPSSRSAVADGEAGMGYEDWFNHFAET